MRGGFLPEPGGAASQSARGLVISHIWPDVGRRAQAVAAPGRGLGRDRAPITARHLPEWMRKMNISSSIPSASPSSDRVVELKRAAAEAAARRIQSGMVVGLGTGSTAIHAVALIGQLLRSGELR